MLAALSLAACSQSKGDPCQVSSDCGSGLLCCAGDTPRGVCADTCQETVRDSGTAPDASESSDGEDAGASQ
jgi:hypothetical protein